jgi:hypothetical protein
MAGYLKHHQEVAGIKEQLFSVIFHEHSPT